MKGKRIPSMANLAKESKTPDAPAPAPAPAPESKPDQPPAEQGPVFFKAKRGFRGKALFLYQIAALTVTGGYNSKYTKISEVSLAAFFTSKKHVDDLVKAQILTQAGEGFVKLTKDGLAYMQGRMTGNATVAVQDKADVEALVKAMQTGKWEGKSDVIARHMATFVKI